MTAQPMPHGTVLLEIDEAVATVTLNRPETYNAMNNNLMEDLRGAIEHAEADQSVGVIVLTGSGRGFCAGADLNTVGPTEEDSGISPPASSAIVGMDRYFNPCLRAIKNCTVPTIARVNGAAAGGGLGLALACDIVIAAQSAFFVATFGPRLGIVPDLGTTWSLPAKIGTARAMGMAMLGDRVPANQAEEWGLIYKAVADDDLDTEVARAANVLKVTSAAAMRRIRSTIETAALRSFSDQLDVERDHQEHLIPLNMGEGAAAFVEKRDPKFR